MLEYLAILLVFSLILTAILSLLKKYIPLDPRIIYGAVGISFILGAFFPITIVTLTPPAVMAVFFALIVTIALALGYAESRIYLNPSGVTPQDIILDHENPVESPVDDYGPSEREIAYSKACGAQEQDMSSTILEDAPATQQEFECTNDLENADHGNVVSEDAASEDAALEDKALEDAVSEDVSFIEESIPAEKDEPPTIQESADTAGQVVPEPVYLMEIAAAGHGDTCHDQGRPLHAEENNRPVENITDETTFPVTINDFISAGFKAKATGDLIGAMKFFITAFQMNKEQHVTTTLALEICTIYQGLGQYFQAMLILKSVIEKKNFINDLELRKKINERLIYLEILTEFLRITKMPHAPYSKIPDIIKVKANLEKNKKLIELNQGGGIN